MTKQLYDFEYQGRDYSGLNLTEIEETTGINQVTLRTRLKRMSIQEAIDLPVDKSKNRRKQ